MIDQSELETDRYYQAVSLHRNRAEIGRLPAVFGNGREYWTGETIGSDIYTMPEDFLFLCEVNQPSHVQGLPALAVQ
ncbi:hypothetical protein FHX15_005849 [Rhizobium sp. BK650]|uniref:hypothetical protein n=1 Tax=Rhizobium sp. BK650 TaxID=2586990 RepID=UPI00160EC8A4|nr:hypothetical protein [Rhizobium sp. BK650]MBB3660578.1 hypothetical protein [Rhizobium sp. BK650]